MDQMLFMIPTRTQLEEACLPNQIGAVDAKFYATWLQIGQKLALGVSAYSGWTDTLDTRLFILLLEFRDYLIERAPWTVIAIMIPVSIWTAIFTTTGIDFYYAGLFTPVWITIGLNVLAI
ncbi:hypothetical protein CGCSCA5_v009080 [Colletotrichum siamense]|nr:hypothetical protein CGCSCA5_v009080 [Colletotrichum siamense]